MSEDPTIRRVAIALFEGFTALGMYGPIDVDEEFRLVPLTYSESGGSIAEPHQPCNCNLCIQRQLGMKTMYDMPTPGYVKGKLGVVCRLQRI
jgi:hypothetical protein